MAIVDLNSSTFNQIFP